MTGFKPSQEIWRRVNAAIFDENAGVVLVTLISGMCGILQQAGVAVGEDSARAQLAAMILSPDDRPVGSLAQLLPAEFERLRDGKEIQ